MKSTNFKRRNANPDPFLELENESLLKKGGGGGRIFVLVFLSWSVRKRLGIVLTAMGLLLSGKRRD